MGQALYRKYRSKSLDTIVGQEHITDTLARALAAGKLAHAYLFTGPRGTGKTSIARILAHQINGLPYTDESSHLDIIEIDAASNRRIDEIRDLRDKVAIAPAAAKYKVYIIDEVHMLTREAFNALLKTLEEPPEHVVFILATTEVHKLPETIISRTQRFMFKPVELDKVSAHLRSIADSEGLVIDDEALALIAAHGEGSFRDSISLLDQCRGMGDKVSAADVRLMIGLPSDEAIGELRQAIDNHDAARIVTALTDQRMAGFTAAQVAKRLARQLRQDVLEGRGHQGNLELLAKLLEVPASHQPEAYLELLLLEYALSGLLPSAPVASALPAATPPASPVRHRPAQAPVTSPPLPAVEPVKEAPPQPVAEPEPEPKEELAPPTGPVKPLDATTWPQVLEEMRQHHNTLYGIVRMAAADFKDDTVELYFKFAFHQKRVNEPKNRDVVLSAIRTVTGRNGIVTCLLAAKDTPETAAVIAAPPSTGGSSAASAATAPAATPGAVTDPATLATINDIFGPAEVLSE